MSRDKARLPLSKQEIEEWTRDATEHRREPGPWCQWTDWEMQRALLTIQLLSDKLANTRTTAY